MVMMLLTCPASLGGGLVRPRLGRVGAVSFLAELCEKLCRQVKELQEEVSSLHRVGKGDLRALCRGAAEMRLWFFRKHSEPSP